MAHRSDAREGSEAQQIYGLLPVDSTNITLFLLPSITLEITCIFSPSDTELHQNQSDQTMQLWKMLRVVSFNKK